MTKLNDNANPAPIFTSTDIELFSTIYAVTKAAPTVSRDLLTGYGAFTCACTDQVQFVINGYAAGTLMVNARDLLFARRRLFRAVRDLGSL